jgi:hypothetical protein
MKVGMDKFDVIVKPDTRHHILINLDSVKYDRH